MEALIAKILEILFTKLYSKVIVPLLKEAVRRGAIVVDQQKGKIKIKKILKAKEENNHEDYTDHLDDAFD